MDYDDLRELGFPTDAFDDGSLIWWPFMPDINTGPEVFVAQANFLPGACLLTAAIHHSVSDGTGLFTVFRLWADHCKVLRLESSLPHVPPPPPESYDHNLLERIWINEGRSKSIDAIDPATWGLFGINPQDLEPDESPNDEMQFQESETVITTPRIANSAIFYIPPAQVIALQKECAKGLGLTTTGISGNDVISALIWRCLLRARSTAVQYSPSSQQSNGDTIAHLAMSFDARPNFSKSVPPNYLGNLAMLHHSRLPLSSLTSPDTSIGVVSKTIRESANAITTAGLLDAYTLARSVPNFGRLILRPSGLDGSTMIITSLLMFPIYNASFGDSIFGNKGVPEAVRPLMSPFNRWTRIGFILPRKLHGGVEFVVNLFDEEMEILLKDEEFGKHAMLLS
jgi:hypothetical protein